MKLKNVQAYPIKDVPDFLVEECKNLGIKLMIEILPLLENVNPNICLGAISFVHASMIKNAVSDKIDQQEKAALLAATSLIKNVGFLNNIDSVNKKAE